jgi:hypothetical protein
MNLDYLCGFAVNQSLGATDSGSIARIGIIYDGWSEEDCGRAEGAMGSVEGEAAKAA